MPGHGCDLFSVKSHRVESLNPSTISRKGAKKKNFNGYNFNAEDAEFSAKYRRGKPALWTH